MLTYATLRMPMPLTATLALVVTAAAAAVGLGRRFTERGRVSRELRRAVLGSETAEGAHVRVTGVVRVFERSLVAPLSGRACVAYRSRASARSPGNRSPGKAPLVSFTPESLVIVPFVLDRGAEGAVLVHGDHALFDVPAVDLSDCDPERRHQFLILHGLTSEHNVTAGFKELVIEPGMTITVVGVMMKDMALAPPSDELAFREAPAPTVQLTGNRAHPLAIAIAR